MRDPEPDQQTNPSLLFRLRDPADADAWRTFVATYAPLIYAYGRKLGLQDADAADVAQEVLSRVVRSMRRFVYDRRLGRFRDWLRTVTRRRVLRFLGKQNRAQAATDRLADVAADSADAEWADEFYAQVLRVGMQRIRPQFEPATWLAFESVWLRGQAASQAAHDLGIPVDLVYAAKFRVLKRLKQEVLILAEDLPYQVREGG